jgi:flagellar assembly protein FliH
MQEREYHRGFLEGRASAHGEMERERAETRRHELESLGTLLRSMQEQMQGFLDSLEREAFRFALAAAGVIVRREVALDSEMAIRQVREALRRVVGVESVILRVHPDDEPAVREGRQQLLSSTDSLREFIVEPDEKVERGGCIIESPSGTIDARIATQLRQIESALLGQPGEARRANV